MASKVLNILPLSLFFFTFFFTYIFSYEWHSAVSEENVKTFATFIGDTFQKFSEKGIVTSVHYKDSKGFEQQKRMKFYAMFVKFGAEIAHFQMENGGIGGICSQFKIGFGESESYACDFEYDEKLEIALASEYKQKFFCQNDNESLPTAEVIDQILLLTFSLALRLKFNAIFAIYPMFVFFHSNEIENWQVRTLLTAYKQLSNAKGITEHGVFPFKLSQLSDDKKYAYWLLKFIEEEPPTHKQYIENFNFIIKISEFSLSPFDVYKVLEAILSNVNEKENIVHKDGSAEVPKLYEFVRDYFSAKINSAKASNSPKSPSLSIDCVLVHLGHQLQMNAADAFNYQKIRELTEKHRTDKNGCEKWHEDILEVVDLYEFKEELGYRIAPIELELFNEPIRNYAKAIEIDTHQCKALTQFANDTLDKMVKENTDKNEHFDGLQIVLRILKEMKDTENYEKLKKLLENFEQKIANEKNKSLLKELKGFLMQLIGEYSCTGYCTQINGRGTSDFGVKISVNKIMPIFGQILFEALEKSYGQTVEYNVKEQKLSFPSELGEHLLERLDEMIKMFEKASSISSSVGQIGQKLDFVKTIQNIASTDTLKLNIKRSKSIPDKVNGQLFELLLSLAIRLTMQIENDEKKLARKYLETFLRTFQSIEKSEPHFIDGIFQLQMNYSHKMIEIHLTNWHLPYYMQEKNMKKLKQQKANENFNLLLSLSNYSTNFYEVLKFAKKLSQIEKNQILIDEKDPKFFVDILNHLRGQNKSEGILKVENEFCLLAFIVNDLLDKMPNEINKITIRESDDEDESVSFIIGQFLNVGEKFCENKIRENEMEKYLKFSEAIKIDHNPHNVLKQIASIIIQKIKQNSDLNYAEVNCEIMVEWELVEFYLIKTEQREKWKQIDQLRNEWCKSYDKHWLDKKQILENTVDEPKKQILEKTVDEPKKQILEKTVDEPKKQILENTVDEPKKQILENTVDEPKKQILENTVDEPKKQILEKTVDEPKKQILEKTVDEPKKQILENTVDEPKKQILENTVDEPKKQILEKTVDEPKKQILETVDELIEVLRGIR